MTNPHAHYINGEWLPGAGEHFLSTCPTNDTVIWEGRHATNGEITHAYGAARTALPNWANLSRDDRKAHLHAFAKQVEQRREALTALIALETGKPRWEAETETRAVIAKIDISIDAAHERTSAHFETDDSGITSAIRYKPHGVIAIIGPFNFPAHLSNGHIVPALLAGNTIVYKPSELTPAVAAFMMQCWHDSGLPAGVLNLIQGDSRTAISLLNEDIQGVLFTGSYRTGLAIHQQFTHRPEVIVALEMGGNNPLVIDRVQNLPAAVYCTLLSSFITAGQRCSAARRILIPNTAHGDDFLNQLERACKSLHIGGPNDTPEPFMGPVISRTHALQHVHSQHHLQMLGGQSLVTMALMDEKGGFLSPGIIDMTGLKTPPDDEIFAPLIQIYRYEDFDEALALANQTRYGLAAGLLSDHHEAYTQFYQTMRAGLLYWNRPTTGASSKLPFGGIGCSGNHRPSAYFAVDYCAYPIANVTQPQLTLPDVRLPGIKLEP